MANKSIEATGTLKLTIDDRELSATVVFSRGEGKRWTLDQLLELMSSQGIVHGFKKDEVRRLFNLISDKPSPYTFKVAEGISPVESRPETVNWEVSRVPPELESQAESVLGRSKQPEIHVERREKVTRTKTVKSKPKMPFLKPREEKKEVVEEKVRSERVYVDPTVERTGYALTGEKLGTIEPPEEGEPGKNVKGEVVPIAVLADPNFYPGTGIARREDELFAEYEGFVRVGNNWADIVPFETHGWEVEISEDQVSAYLSFDPGDRHAVAPTEEEIAEAAVAEGYDRDRLIPAEEISRLVSHAVETGEQLVKAPLTQSRDSGFDIFVSDDKLKAVLNLNKGTGRGAPLDYRALGSAIKQSRLVGLDYDKIKQDLSEFNKGAETELTGYVLAEGTPAEPGPERTVEFSVRFLPAERTADLKSHLEQVIGATVHPESLKQFPISMVEDLGYVEAEQRLLAISPPVAGKPGKDVFGQAIAGDAAPEPRVVALENVEEKGNVYISTIAGLMQRGWSDGVTYVRVLEHQDADVSVELSPAKMAAFVAMKAGFGSGRKLEWDAVEQVVADAGVGKGVNVELLHRAHEAAVSGTEIRDLIFARGKHPTSASEGEVEMLIELASGKDLTIRGDGSADFKNQERITAVTAGTPLARIHSQVAEAQDGWDVTGETLRAGQTESREIDAGANVSIREEDGGSRVLVADIDGELVFDEDRFEVRAGHTVDGDVDLSTGNVKFPGNVTVTGSVKTGFYVVASGDIHVGELVEASLLSANGDIVINQGVKGAGKAVLRTRQNVGMLFGEQVTILAVGNVMVKNSLVHATVRTNGKVRMNGDKSTILGGEIRCRSGLQTRNLGSERGVRTLVTFGQNYLIADQIEREEKEMAKVKKEIAEIDFAIHKKESGQDVDALHSKKLMLLKMLEKRGLRVFTLRERFEEHQESEIVVTGTLHPGVVFESHGRSLEITSERKNVVVTFNPESGKIDVSGGAGDGADTPVASDAADPA